MKNTFRTFGVLTLALFSVACNKNEVEIQNPVEPEYSYTFVIGNNSKAADTKSTFDSDENGLFLKWDATDKLTTWSVSSIGSNGTSYSNNSEINEGENPVTFTIKSYKAIAENDKIYATYPQLSSPGQDLSSVTLSIPVAQQYTDGAYDASSMPLVAAPFGISAAIDNSETASSTESAVSFYNLGSVIELSVYSPNGTYADEKIQSVAIEATDNLAGTFTFNMAGVDSDDASTLEISGLSANKVSTSIEDVTVGTIAKASALKYYLVVAPGTYSGEITVTTDKAIYYYDFNGKTFERAAVKKFIVNLEKEGARFTATTTEEEFFKETFAGADGASGWSGNAAAAAWAPAKCDNSGWSVSNGFMGDGCAKFGTSTKQGVATTPALGITTTTATLSFKAGAWSGDNTNLKLSITGGGTIDKSSVTMKNAEWDTFAVTITGGTSSTKITFTGNAAKNSRFFLDDIVVTGSVTSGKDRGGIESKTIDEIAARGLTGSLDIALTDFDVAPSLTIIPDGSIVSSAEVTSVSTTSATISYIVAPNYSSAAREGSIEISKGLSRGTITINQLADVFTVSRTSVELQANTGATATITVTSDYDWAIDNTSLNGFTVSPNSFTYSGNQKQTVTITATGSNTTSTIVELDLFNIVRTADGKESADIAVSQKSAKLAAPDLTLTPDATNKKFTVSWTSVDNATKYEYYVLDGAAEYKVAVVQTEDATTTSFDVTDINLGEEYTVSVKAIGDNNPWIDSEESVDAITVTATSLPVSFSTSDFEGQGTSGTGSNISATKSNLTVSSDKGYADETSHVRIYSGGIITVSSSSGNIAKIEFTSTASGASSNGPGKISLKTGEAGSYSYSGSKGTWSGDASSVTFSASAQFRFTEVVVTFK